MHLAVCRTKKFKSHLEITRAIKHNYRLIPCSRDLNSKPPGWLHGGPDAPKVANERLKGLTVRKNATYAFEVVLSASPGFFREDADAAGTYDFATTEEFESCCVQWLNEFFTEENVISSCIHYSEKTPHIHAVILPIDPKGKLNASHWLDGREKLSLMQDSFAAKLAPLGIGRGQRVQPGEKSRRHKTLKEFYALFVRLSASAFKATIQHLIPTPFDNRPSPK